MLVLPFINFHPDITFQNFPLNAENAFNSTGKFKPVIKKAMVELEGQNLADLFPPFSGKLITMFYYNAKVIKTVSLTECNRTDVQPS